MRSSRVLPPIVGIAALMGAAPTLMAQDPPTSSPPAPSRPASSVEDWLTEGPPAFTDAEARAWRDAVLPAVERVTGHTFTRTPEIMIVDREQLADQLVEDRRHLLSLLGNDRDTELTELLLSLDAVVRAPGILGLAQPRRDTVLLPAGNFAPMLAVAGETTTPIDAIGRLVIAHELAHLLHQQDAPLTDQLDRLRSTDGLRAYRMLSEGFAMLVQEQVATSLGLEEENRALVDAMSLTSVKSDAAGFARRYYRDIYEAGWHFCRSHHESGGMAHVWDVLADPPRTANEVRWPETYGQVVGTRIDPERLFRGIEDRLLVPGGPVVPMTIDGGQVMQAFASLGPETADRIKANIRSAHTARIGSAQVMHTAVVYELDDPEYGPALLHAIGRILESRIEPMRARIEQLGATISRDATTRTHGGGFDAVWEREIDVSGPNLPAPQSLLRTVSAWRGPYLAQVTVTGGTVDAEAARAVLDELLTRIASGAATVAVMAESERDPLARAVRAVQAFLDPGWQSDSGEIPKAAIEALVGDRIDAQIALEMGFERGRSYDANGPSTPGAARSGVNVVLLQFQSAELTEPMPEALLAGMVGRFEQILPAGALVFQDPQRRRLDDGTEVIERLGTMTVPSLPAQSFRAVTTRRDRWVITLFDIENALGERRDAAIRAIFDAVKEEESGERGAG